jgi:hypothetical protein
MKEGLDQWWQKIALLFYKEKNLFRDLRNVKSRIRIKDRSRIRIRIKVIKRDPGPAAGSDSLFRMAHTGITIHFNLI